MPDREKFLARHTTASLFTLLQGKKPVIALVPIGSTEPHGPHLGLGTDVVISAAACVRACEVLDKKGPLTAVIAPAVSYGVTDCALGFPGAVSIPPAVLTAYVGAICDGLLAQGLRHVCLVNNHLEPAHDTAIRAVLAGREGKVSYACPLTKKWARTLSAEFKSGACHAGQYETSLVLASRPELVDVAASGALAEVPISLSDGIRDGKVTFRDMGMSRAYAGAPAAASAHEGNDQLDKLAAMIVGEVTEAIALSSL